MAFEVPHTPDTPQEPVHYIRPREERSTGLGAERRDFLQEVDRVRGEIGALVEIDGMRPGSQEFTAATAPLMESLRTAWNRMSQDDRRVTQGEWNQSFRLGGNWWSIHLRTFRNDTNFVVTEGNEPAFQRFYKLFTSLQSPHIPASTPRVGEAVNIPGNEPILELMNKELRAMDPVTLKRALAMSDSDVTAGGGPRISFQIREVGGRYQFVRTE